jgi:hypothetical protein
MLGKGKYKGSMVESASRGELLILGTFEAYDNLWEGRNHVIFTQ